MKEFEFTLKYTLPSKAPDPESYLDRLFEAGCDDALVGVGVKGRISLEFTRAARNASDAVLSAMADVQAAIPDARFVEASPDMVGMTEVATLAGCSRQNIRKLALSDDTFPTAVHGGSVELFHLAEVLDWMSAKGRAEVDPSLVEVAMFNREINLVKELDRLPGRQPSQALVKAYARRSRAVG